MGERRKRKSMWDMENETKQFSGMSEHISSVGKEHHSSHDIGRNDHDRKEMDGGNRFYERMSPEFDGIERHKYKPSLENNRSDSHRYMGRARSRSRSRSRSRDRGRERGRGLNRSRSSSRGRTRSRSPIRDSKNQSYKSSDRKNLPDKSEKICRDFSSGRCRRGSQCKFFHSKNSSRNVEAVDRGHISQNVSNSYHREDEQFQNKGKSLGTCREFVKGKCKWGDTCRFSHHLASNEKTFDEVAEYRKPLCKYFAAGKCDKDNCRFSHEDPTLNGRRDEFTNGGPETHLVVGPNLLTGEQFGQFTSSPVTNPAVLPVPRIENEQFPNNAETQVSIIPMENENYTERDDQMQAIVDMDWDNLKVDNSVDENNQAIAEENKGVEDNKHSETVDVEKKVEESTANKDEKAMRIFKNSLIEFVKEILKPTWKEGRLSREVHKSIVKKVVDKVISTIQVDHIPKTQEKVDQYLSFSKPKIAKLVQAYVERSLKTDS